MTTFCDSDDDHPMVILSKSDFYYTKREREREKKLEDLED